MGIKNLVHDVQLKRQKEIRDMMKKKREKAVLVDRISRWLFPTSFILLNIVYWALFGDHELWWVQKVEPSQFEEYPSIDVVQRHPNLKKVTSGITWDTSCGYTCVLVCRRWRICASPKHRRLFFPIIRLLLKFGWKFINGSGNEKGIHVTNDNTITWPLCGSWYSRVSILHESYDPWYDSCKQEICPSYVISTQTTSCHKFCSNPHKDHNVECRVSKVGQTRRTAFTSNICATIFFKYHI